MSARGKHKKDVVGILLLLILAVLPLLIFYVILHLSGPQWDMAVRMLQGRTLLNFFTHNASLHTAFGGEAYPNANNLLYYFEPYREPLEIPIFAALRLFFTETALPYVILIYALYLLALHKLSKSLGLERLVLFSVMINSYIIYFLFIPNGGEALSVVLALIGVVCLIEKKASSGLFFGLASLAKYPSLCLFPLVLLLPDRKKMVQAIILEVLMVVIWGVLVDYGIYGLPFYSYIESIGAAGVASGTSTIAASALVTVLSYPLLFIAIAVVLLVVFKSKIKARFDYRAKVIVCFAAISLLCYLVILPHNDPFTQARYGYLAAVSLLALAAVYMGKAAAINPNIKYAIAIFSICLLFYALWLSYASNNNPGAASYNYAHNNGIYAHAESELGGVGFGGCRFISNAWVPMVYSGYSAYSPFVLYAGNGTVQIIQQTTAKFGPAVANFALGLAKRQLQVLNSSYRTEEAEYPMVVFNYTGVPRSLLLNLNDSRLVYADQNVSIYLPQNATCYR